MVFPTEMLEKAELRNNTTLEIEAKTGIKCAGVGTKPRKEGGIPWVRVRPEQSRTTELQEQEKRGRTIHQKPL